MLSQILISLPVNVYAVKCIVKIDLQISGTNLIVPNEEFVDFMCSRYQETTT